MKTFIRIIAIYPLLVSMAFAAGGPQHEGGVSGMEAQGQHGKQGGMMMSMKEHMQSMQEMMKNLKQESNPEKRSELIEQHMQAMQKGMMMMNESSGEGNASMPMDQRMEMMNKRMDMMQMMMGQMMDGMVEARKGQPKHLKK